MPRVGSLSSLTNAALLTSLEEDKPYFKSMFKGEQETWRHARYAMGGKARRDLRHCVIDGGLHEDQVDLVHTGLLRMFSLPRFQQKYDRYIVTVLFPEYIIRLAFKFLTNVVTVADARQAVDTYREADN